MVFNILRFYGAVFNEAVFYKAVLMYKESLSVKIIIFIVILSSFKAIKLIQFTVN